MTTQNATSAFQQNLENLCRIIEESFGIGSLTLFSDKASISDFPAILGALDKVSAAVGFQVKEGNLLVDIARRMA